MNHPLNTILYGPPGTGKTYRTFRRCVEICDGSGDNVDAVAIRSRYGQLVDEKRVEFVTFHQSYGYEEFVEGLRPEAVEGGGLRLVSRDGVLKRMAERAVNAPLEGSGQKAVLQGVDRGPRAVRGVHTRRLGGVLLAQERELVRSAVRLLPCSEEPHQGGKAGLAERFCPERNCDLSKQDEAGRPPRDTGQRRGYKAL